jgi:hypothetical protein
MIASFSLIFAMIDGRHFLICFKSRSDSADWSFLVPPVLIHVEILGSQAVGEELLLLHI